MARAAWGSGFALVALLALAMTGAAYAERLPPAIPHTGQWDKLVHFAVAGLLASTLDGALGRRDLRVAGRSVPAAVAVVLVATGLEECLQSLSAVREASLLDYAADVAGAVVLTWLARQAAARRSPPATG